MGNTGEFRENSVGGGGTGKLWSQQGSVPTSAGQLGEAEEAWGRHGNGRRAQRQSMLGDFCVLSWLQARGWYLVPCGSVICLSFLFLCWSCTFPFPVQEGRESQ